MTDQLFLSGAALTKPPPARSSSTLFCILTSLSHFIRTSASFFVRPHTPLPIYSTDLIQLSYTFPPSFTSSCYVLALHTAAIFLGLNFPLHPPSIKLPRQQNCFTSHVIPLVTWIVSSFRTATLPLLLFTHAEKQKSVTLLSDLNLKYLSHVIHDRTEPNSVSAISTNQIICMQQLPCINSSTLLCSLFHHHDEQGTDSWCIPTPISMIPQHLNSKYCFSVRCHQQFIRLEHCLGKTHLNAFLGILSKAFSNSINTWYSLLFSKYFSCNCLVI